MRCRKRLFEGVVLLLVALGCIDGFAQTPETRSVDGLIYDLQHPDPIRRAESARILGSNKVRAAVPALIEATRDSESDVRFAAANALVQINDTRALNAFVDLTRDPEIRIRRLAVQGIVDVYVLAEDGFTSELRKVVTFLNPLSTGYDERIVEPYIPVSESAVKALIDLLFIDDSGLRRDAAVALGILRAQSALPAIHDALSRESSNDIRVELIRALYKIGDPEAGKALIPLIRDPDNRVRDEAIITCGRLRVREAAPDLNELYRAGIEERKRIFGVVPVSGPDDLQRRILEALGNIGDSSSRDIFEDALNDSRDHYRRFGAEGLGRMGDKAYVTLIATKRLRENSKSVQLAMGFALFLLGREEHIIELVDRASDSQAFYYLMELPADKVPLLFPYVQTGSDSTVIRLLEVIGMRGDTGSIPLVQELTGHSNADVASAANLALRRLNGRLLAA